MYGGAVALRQEHLKHEGAVKSIAVLSYLGAALFLGIGIYAKFYAVEGATPEGYALIAGMIVLQVTTAIGIQRLKPWARYLAGIAYLPGLLIFPIGTIITIYILYLLFSRKGGVVFSKEYREAIARTPHITQPSKIRMYVLFLILILFLVGIMYYG